MKILVNGVFDDRIVHLVMILFNGAKKLELFDSMNFKDAPVVLFPSYSEF